MHSALRVWRHWIRGNKQGWLIYNRGLNVLTVRYFGISEFYLSIFKIFLMLALMLYTFITMLGGNPQGDRYGFRYWRDPVSLPPAGWSLSHGSSRALLYPT